MTKPGSNPYTRKLKPVMTKYLTGRFGAAEGASRWREPFRLRSNTGMKPPTSAAGRTFWRTTCT